MYILKTVLQHWNTSWTQWVYIFFKQQQYFIFTHCYFNKHHQTMADPMVGPGLHCRGPIGWLTIKAELTPCFSTQLISWKAYLWDEVWIRASDWSGDNAIWLIFSQRGRGQENVPEVDWCTDGDQQCLVFLTVVQLVVQVNCFTPTEPPGDTWAQWKHIGFYCHY